MAATWDSLYGLGSATLDKAVTVKLTRTLAMIPLKELLPLTGYVHGGCSPIGMKKQFVTTIDECAKEWDSIIFSGGKIGYQVQVELGDLKKVIPFELADICEE